MLDAAYQADPQHLEAAYNLALLRWREGEVTDLYVLDVLDRLRASRINRPAWLLPYARALVQAERGAAEAARGALLDARAKAGSKANPLLQGRDDVPSYRMLHSLRLDSGVTGLAVDRGGESGVAVGIDGVAQAFTMAEGKVTRTLDGVTGDVAIGPNGQVALPMARTCGSGRPSIRGRWRRSHCATPR